MTADSSNPKALWQGQSPETDPMTLEQIHAIARRMDGKTRLGVVMLMLSAGLIAFLVARAWPAMDDPLRRTGFLLTIAGALFVMWRTFGLILPRRDPAEAGAAFLQRQMRQWMRYNQGGWMLSAAALLPGLAVNLGGIAVPVLNCGGSACSTS